MKKGLIKETLTPVLVEKLKEYSMEVIGQTMPGDDKTQITEDILQFIKNGADMVLCSGGMSVGIRMTVRQAGSKIQEPGS